MPVASRLDQDVDHVPVLIHGTLQILPLTVDGHEDFVQEPCISESTLSSSQTPYILETELPAPAAECLVGHDDSSFGQQIFNISETDTESVVEPDGMTDDFAWISVPMIERSVGFHAASLPGTVPS